MKKLIMIHLTTTKNVKIICLTFLLLFTSPLMAQDISKDYLVFTKTTGYPRRILMPINQKINIHLKVDQKFSEVYLSKINPDNLVLSDSRVISIDLIDRISGRTVVYRSDENFGKIMVGLGVTIIILSTAVVVLALSEGDSIAAAYAAIGIPVGFVMVPVGIRIWKGRKTFNTKKWKLSLQLGV